MVNVKGNPHVMFEQPYPPLSHSLFWKCAYDTHFQKWDT